MQLSNKHWQVILAIVGMVIAGLLAIIVWKLLPVSMDNYTDETYEKTPVITADAPFPDKEKDEAPPESLNIKPLEPKPIEPEVSSAKAVPERDAVPLIDDAPSSPVVGKQVDSATIRSFGSQKILNNLWTSEQLHGSLADKKIRKSPSDHSEPNRILAKHHLKPLASDRQGSIRRVRLPDPSKKLVALTFDLCERAAEVTGYDAAVVNYLRDNNIKATFYAGGKWMRSHPEKTKQLMADPQFEIGNHAWTHGNMRVLSVDDLQAQVLWTQAQYELLWEELGKEAQQSGISPAEINKIPALPLSFRYPYGTCGVEALDLMAEQGLPSIQWNIVTADPWGKQTADGIAKTVVQGIKPGSIIIAHANGRGWKTSEALPKFIPALKAQGYEFVTVTELLNAGIAVEATDTCFELKPGDNQFYDQKVGKGTE